MAEPAARRADTDGLVVVDKPAGWTSHDAVARCRKVFGQRKVGHAGTLDPDATGVLLVGLGRVTRLLRYLTGLSKSYTGQVVLGVATSTLDDAGEVRGRWDMGAVTVEQARAAAAGLTGVIDQVPPMVSAVHVGGRRLHELARAGLEVERPTRRVEVTRFEVHASGDLDDRHGGSPVFDIVVDCSSGTYVRSLAADLGAALGGGAHLRRLRRTAAGPFRVEDACPLDEVGPDAVLGPRAALGDMSVLAVDGDLLAAVGHGRVLDRARLEAEGEGPWAVVGPAGELLAVYEAHGPRAVKPSVVLAAAGG